MGVGVGVAKGDAALINRIPDSVTHRLRQTQNSGGRLCPTQAPLSTEVQAEVKQEPEPRQTSARSRGERGMLHPVNRAQREVDGMSEKERKRGLSVEGGDRIIFGAT